MHIPARQSCRVLKALPCAAVFAFHTVGALAAVGPSDTHPNLLAGPDVGEKSLPQSLVSRGLDGEVQTLPAPPAIAALELLTLDDATRERVNAVLADRAALIDTLVLSNIELLSQAETIMAVGKPVEKFELLRDGLKAMEPVRKWGKLDRRLSEALPREHRAEYREQIAEYERLRYESARAAGELDNKVAYRVMRYWEDIAWELERAAERVFVENEDGEAWLRHLSEKLELTPDQQGEIRAMAERYFIDAKGRPSKEEEMAFVAKIRTVMSIEQRWKFTALLLRGELEPKHTME